MYQLYCILKDREEPPTLDETEVASAKRKLDGNTEAEYLQKLEKSAENIKKAFQDQQARAMVSENSPVLFSLFMTLQKGPWNQEKFKRLLTEWIVACDQPFEEVERPEFIAMMNAARHTCSPLKIPKRKAIKRCVMKMGEETIGGVREMFSV